LDGRQLLVLIAFLDDELATDFSRAEARIQALGTEVGIGLTLAIHDSPQVLQEHWQVGFSPLPTAGGTGIQAAKATGEFMHAFAYRDAVPPEFPFSSALAPWPELLDGARHK
jgi:hypothetical protein